MTWFEAIWRLVSVLTDAGPTGLLADTGALAGLPVIAMLAVGRPTGRRAVTADPGQAGRALRRRALRAGVPPHRDPDAAGRARRS